MMYKVPRPSRSKGVKLHTIGDHEIGIEYTEGEPHVGKMAFDSQCGIMSRNITFVARDAAMMPKAGNPPIRSNEVKADTMEYDDDASKVISTLTAYLEKYLDPDQMDAVKLILSSGDAPDLDAGEPNNYQATDRRRVARLAADAARQRPLSAAAERDALAMFPNWNRLS